MALEVWKCTNELHSLMSTCMPTISTGLFSSPSLNTEQLFSNINSGVCNSLLQSSLHCLNLNALNILTAGDSWCYASQENMKECLPGAVSNLTKSPNACHKLSMFIFFSNEASTFLTGIQKLSLIFLTYWLRQIEVQECLYSCHSHNYVFMGELEEKKEVQRYVSAGMSKVSEYAIPLVTGALATAVLGPAGGALNFEITRSSVRNLNYLRQIANALPQQRLRNLDFKEAYGNCTYLPQMSNIFSSFIPSRTREVKQISTAPEQNQVSTSDITSTALKMTYSFFSSILEIGKFALKIPYFLLYHSINLIFSVGYRVLSFAYGVTSFVLEYLFYAVFYQQEPKKLPNYEPPTNSQTSDSLSDNRVKTTIQEIGINISHAKKMNRDAIKDANAIWEQFFYAETDIEGAFKSL